MLDDLAVTIRQIAEVLAARVGRSADELPVRAFAGAVIGAGIGVWLTGSGSAPLTAQGMADLMKDFDAAMVFLDGGLRL